MPRIRGSLALPVAVGLLTLAAAGDTQLSPIAQPASAREPALAVLSMLEPEPKLTVAVKRSKAVAPQLDLVYDPQVMELRGGTASPAVEAAGKRFTVHHLTAGRARVAVFGSHRDPLPAGELGTVTFHPLRRDVETEVFAVHRHAADASGHGMATRAVRAIQQRPLLRPPQHPGAGPRRGRAPGRSGVPADPRGSIPKGWIVGLATSPGLR